ncbi:MAG: nitroreductase family protein [Acidimicrobiia bacterium]|nr:nitroreductase family protein [Acidimicrobiia bacterium]
MELADAIASTRAIRRYRPDPIPDEDLAAILFAATRAPSGSNRQPFRFVVLRDHQRTARARALLGDAFRAAWDAKRDADGYDRGSGQDPSTPKARMAATMEHFVDHIADAPVIVLACLELRRPPGLHDGASVYPACQNLLLAARDRGYGGVITMWHQLVVDELTDALGLPENVAIAAAIPLGRPAGAHGPVRRRPMHELVFEDRWGSPAPWATEPERVGVAGGPPTPTME